MECLGLRPPWRHRDLQSVDSYLGTADQGGAQHVQNGDGGPRTEQASHALLLMTPHHVTRHITTKTPDSPQNEDTNDAGAHLYHFS